MSGIPVKAAPKRKDPMPPVPSEPLITDAKSTLEDEDYTGVVDAVILWWRDDDGDLTDALVDTLGTLAEGSSIVLLTPRPGQDGEVDPSEVDEAATTAGLHTSGSVMCSEHWVATRLAARKGVA